MTVMDQTTWNDEIPADAYEIFFECTPGRDSMMRCFQFLPEHKGGRWMMIPMSNGYEFIWRGRRRRSSSR